MKSATELLEGYLDNVRTPQVSAAQFAEDGVLELPWQDQVAAGSTQHRRGRARIQQGLTMLSRLGH